MNALEDKIADIQKHAKNIRRNIIKMLAHAGSGHTAGSLDLADIFATLYCGGVMNYDPKDPTDPNRDVLFLSAGHTCPVLYATLAEIGAISDDELMTLRQFGSRLQGHPERTMLPYLESTSGPLGCGLSQAAGYAYAKKYLDRNEKPHVYVVTGDGELDEGNIWEAALFAGKNKLDNLTLFVDRNSIQLSGGTEKIMPLEPLTDKWASFGFETKVVDGNSPAELLAALGETGKSNKPVAIIAKTIPAKGVSFMEGDYHWHGKTPNAEQAELALKELA